MDVHKPQKYFGVITKKIQLTQTVFHFFIQHIQPQDMLFTPGQYATFIVDSKTRRQYSFCSAVHASSYELVVDVAPMGVGSRYFLEKQVGDHVEYLAPLGQFGMSDTSLKKIFIATGTGIAPFRSMLLNGISNFQFLISNQNQNSNDQNRISIDDKRQTMNGSLYWGLRHEDDVYWDTEFRALAGQLTGFQYFLVLSKPRETWQGLKGHVTDFVFQNEKNMENCEFYLCGNNAMITEAMTILSDRKVRKEQIKTDLFY